MIQSPARYAPYRNPENAKQRRDTVIAAMTNQGSIDENSGHLARALPVQVAPFEGSSNELAPYYVDAVNRAMDDAQRGLETDAEQGLRVQTTIDPDLQTAAENALRHRWSSWEKHLEQKRRRKERWWLLIRTPVMS